MVEIEKPRIECIDSTEDVSYGKYVVEPLERGYGTTLGNSLRRILLSSLPGTAATSIKIAGIQHEFSTIPGVKEDVTEIVLNVKKIIAELYCQGVKTVYIDAAGECEVCAGDIKADGEVEILNPELHICSLGPDATFNMEITLSRGRGYVPADRNKPAQSIIGVIPIDSIYTPVYKCNYTVENTRVGNMTDYDKLTLELWTDRTDLVEQLLGDVLLGDPGQSLAVGRQVLFLGQRNHALGHRLDLLGAVEGSLHLPVLKEIGRHSPEHRLALVAGPPELSRSKHVVSLPCNKVLI